MSPLISSLADKPDALLDVYKSHIRSKLTKQLMPVAEKAVRQAVEDAVDSLDVSIRAAYVGYTHELVIKLTVDGVDVKP